MTSRGIFFSKRERERERGGEKNENVLNKWAQKRIKRWGIYTPTAHFIFSHRLYKTVGAIWLFVQADTS